MPRETSTTIPRPERRRERINWWRGMDALLWLLPFATHVVAGIPMGVIGIAIAVHLNPDATTMGRIIVGAIASTPAVIVRFRCERTVAKWRGHIKHRAGVE